MTAILILPWVLTVVALLAIMLIRKKKSHTEEDVLDLDDFISEDHDDEDRRIVNVAVYGSKAYWVYDNVFYEADTTQEPDFTTARPVDTMSLPEKKVTQLFAILDKLEKESEEEE